MTEFFAIDRRKDDGSDDGSAVASTGSSLGMPNDTDVSLEVPGGPRGEKRKRGVVDAEQTESDTESGSGDCVIVEAPPASTPLPPPPPSVPNSGACRLVLAVGLSH